MDLSFFAWLFNWTYWKRYLMAVLIALDILASALTGGHASETVSHRIAVSRDKGRRSGCIFCKILDFVFRQKHCDKSIAFYRAHLFDFDKDPDVEQA